MQLREKSAEEHNFSDTLMNQVKAELENIMNPRKSIGKNLGILVVTIFLFVSLGFFTMELK